LNTECTKEDVNGKKIIERRLDATGAADESKASFTVFIRKRSGQGNCGFLAVGNRKKQQMQRGEKIDGKSVSGVPTRNRLVEKS
jgi:hypothetical protein